MWLPFVSVLYLLEFLNLPVAPCVSFYLWRHFADYCGCFTFICINFEFRMILHLSIWLSGFTFLCMQEFIFTNFAFLCSYFVYLWVSISHIKSFLFCISLVSLCSQVLCLWLLFYSTEVHIFLQLRTSLSFHAFAHFGVILCLLVVILLLLVVIMCLFDYFSSCS